jgi:hypothetical protein
VSSSPTTRTSSANLNAVVRHAGENGPLGMRREWRKLSRAGLTHNIRGLDVPVYRCTKGGTMECFPESTFFVGFKVRVRALPPTPQTETGG